MQSTLYKLDRVDGQIQPKGPKSNERLLGYTTLVLQ